MKIAFLSVFYPYRGGIAQFNANVYRELEKSHEVKAFNFKRQYPKILFPGKSQLVNNEDDADKVENDAFLDSIGPLSYYKTAKTIKHYQPDILLMSYWMSFFAPSLGTVAKSVGKNTKVVTIMHNVIPHEKKFFDKTLTKFFIKRNDGLIVMSEQVRKDLYSLTPSNKPSLLIPHPVYDHFGERISVSEAKVKLGLAPEKKTILFFGFIRKYKGLDVLIKAFNELDDNYQLLIGGECYEDISNYQKLIDQNKNKDRIHLHNRYISDEEVPAFFSAAEVCVLPYRSATQSGVTSIAYHFNLPVIATDVGGLKETIEDGKTGSMVSEANPSFIASAISNFYKSSPDRYVDHIRSYKIQHSWQNFVDKLIDFSQGLKK